MEVKTVNTYGNCIRCGRLTKNRILVNTDDGWLFSVPLCKECAEETGLASKIEKGV